MYSATLPGAMPIPRIVPLAAGDGYLTRRDQSEKSGQYAKASIACESIFLLNQSCIHGSPAVIEKYEQAAMGPCTLQPLTPLSCLVELLDAVERLSWMTWPTGGARCTLSLVVCLTMFPRAKLSVLDSSSAGKASICVSMHRQKLPIRQESHDTVRAAVPGGAFIISSNFCSLQ